MKKRIVLMTITIAILFLWVPNFKKIGSENETVIQKADKTILAEVRESENPQMLVIPKINLNADIEMAGLDEHQLMVVPDKNNAVSWFQYGPKPGETGSAVLAGHNVMATGKGVFYDLNRLSVGDVVQIKTDKENIKEFKVEKTKIFNTEEFPVEEIYGTADRKRLNLITCAGKYNEHKHEYEDRLVVYAVLE